MPSQYHQFRSRRFLVVLFLSSFIFCLGLHVPFTTLQARWEAAATAQSPSANQLVQRGIDQYRRGDVQAAIAEGVALQQPKALPSQPIDPERLEC